MVISDFLDDLMPRLPGADETLVKHETLAAAREFCESSNAWIYSVPPQDLPADTSAVAITPLTNTEVGYLLLVEFRDTNADSFRTLPVTLRRPPNPDETAEAPRCYYPESPALLTLYPQPTLLHADGFRADVSLIPVNQAVVFPDTFSSHWRDAIREGVLYRMYSMPSKPWSSGSMAMLHGRSFRNQIKKARDIVKRRYSTTSETWRFPYFAAQ